MRAKRAPSLDPKSMEAAAFAYLERYASSAENLRRVLMRRVARAARMGEVDRGAAEEAIVAILAKLVARGLLSDSAYAEGRAHTLTRRGLSRNRIGRMLNAKGVGSADVEAAMSSLDEAGESDLTAALRFARRKRLGPFRPENQRAERRMRDYAAMARAGFSGSIARRVVDAQSIEALEELASEG